MKKPTNIQQIKAHCTNPKKIWTSCVWAFVAVWFISSSSAEFAFGQAIRINLGIKDKIVLSEQDPFRLRPSIDIKTNTKIMEGTCVFTSTSADNLWVKANLPALVTLRNELGEDIPFSTHLSFRNDGQKEYNGNETGNSAVFPLSRDGKRPRRTEGTPQLYKAYIFVFIRTNLAQTIGDTYSGDVILNIEYN